MTTHQQFDRAAGNREIQELLVASAGVSPQVFEGSDGDTLQELGLESLAVMELQAVVEQRYGVRIPDDALELSVAEIVTYIETHIEEVS
jgi:acyl carrier protein